MLEQHAPHVFALSSSPHRQRSPPMQPQEPRSILKKPSSAPLSPAGSRSPSFLSSPVMSPKTDTFALTAYRPQQWTVVGIARAQQRQSSETSPATSAALSTGLTVTLLYTPTETLYAWPFNLSCPDAKGVCYETHSVHQGDGSVPRPPDGTMSTSLRVLADVIRCWMKIRRERSALEKRRGSDGSIASVLSTPGSSVDEVVDNDEVIDQIVDTLHLHQLTPLDRSVHLLRQKLPLQSPLELSWSSALSDDPQRGRATLDSSSSHGSDDDRDSHHRSDSSASSRASTIETSPEEYPQSKKASSPKLPKINTALPSAKSAVQAPVPQIRLLEATPQEAEYEERNRTLEKAITSASSRNSSFIGRNMDTVHEDDSEDVDYEATPTCDSGEVTFIKIHPCDRSEPEIPTSPKTASPRPSSSSPRPMASKTKLTSSPSATKVFFRDPFKGTSERISSKPSIRVETIEYGSPESLIVSSNKEASKSRSSRKPSFEGLRSMFGGRNKSP
ncbi:uncharacterized protein UTRI_01855 [Ustilago trichophora]|uniref:Uncharacterized protein n=1 Tax=Ustilago trichophora TaxID=86804 RepID=A0A5C3E0U5_9BASI|nr:uncharacterized protein UTRI_01855 [Ustilago trichophora]